LKDQSQIYLPINNALTKVGWVVRGSSHMFSNYWHLHGFTNAHCHFRHVHGFLQEIGQGVQHVASRVGDIVSFVQQANDRRKIFGEVRRVWFEQIICFGSPTSNISCNMS
jgi:hypothetical protein